MVGTVKMLLTRWVSISRNASSISKRSDDSRMVGTPRAVCTSWWMPAPCDSGATTSDASFSVVPGIRSARWLVMTKAIWPWVSTAALERPVVPDVKKNQQGSSYSTSAASMAAPAWAAIASLTDFSPNAPSPIRNAANIDQNISSPFFEWTRMRSPLTMPRAASAAASAETWPSISRQVQDFSPQIKPTRSPCRRAFWVRRCARFITRRDIGVTPPRGAVPVTWRAPEMRGDRHLPRRRCRLVWARPSSALHPHTCPNQHQTRHTRDDAVLDVQAGHAILVSGKEARQLIRRHQAGHSEQDDAEHGQHELHGVSLLE